MICLWGWNSNDCPRLSVLLEVSEQRRRYQLAFNWDEVAVSGSGVSCSNWAHIIETVKPSFMGCGWSLTVLISSWDQSTSDLDNVCVNSCKELSILLIERKNCWCVSVCECLFIIVAFVYKHPNSTSEPTWRLSRPRFRDKLLLVCLHFMSWKRYSKKKNLNPLGPEQFIEPLIGPQRVNIHFLFLIKANQSCTTHMSIHALNNFISPFSSWPLWLSCHL